MVFLISTETIFIWSRNILDKDVPFEYSIWLIITLLKLSIEFQIFPHIFAFEKQSERIIVIGSRRKRCHVPNSVHWFQKLKEKLELDLMIIERKKKRQYHKIEAREHITETYAVSCVVFSGRLIVKGKSSFQSYIEVFISH